MMGRNERMEWNEKKELRRKCQLLPKELEKASLGEGSNIVVRKPTTKRTRL